MAGGNLVVPGGPNGDGGPATQATLFGSGCWEAANYRIRKVNTAGVISTFAGNGKVRFSGDEGPATNAQLGFYGVGRLATDLQGNLYIADTANNRVRKVDCPQS